MTSNTILWIVLINLVLTGIIFLIFKKNYLLIVIYAAIVSCIYYKFPSFETLKFFLLSNLIFGFILHLLIRGKKALNEDVFNIVISTDRGMQTLENFKRGVSIFGSSGSGKTQSGIYNFFRHFAKFDYSGVFYDYKNGELTEMVLGLFKEVKIIAPHNPFISDRINFIAPHTLHDETEINEISKVLIMNLKGKNDKDNFFDENAQALFSALILKFKLDFPNFCTFPHIVAFLTLNDFSGIHTQKIFIDGEEKEIQKHSSFKKLQDFLSSNDRVQIQASAFLLGLDSDKQTAGVLSTLINSLRKIATPNFFWVFSSNDFDLNINHDSNRKIVSILNDPSKEESVTPLVASTLHTITKQMMQRNLKQSFLLIDEAPTIKLLNMARIPATMRSYNIATIYCAQDVTQGYNQYGGVNQFKEILSNLSIQIFGKANDPETAKFYEQYTELIEVDARSISKDQEGIFGTQKGVNLSKKEVRKIRQNDFMKLKEGEFVVISNGESQQMRFSYPDIQTKGIPKKNVTVEEIEYNYDTIIREAKNILS